MTDVVSRPELLGGISRAKAPEPELGTAPIAGERYWSPAFAQREWDHMWTKVWLIAGMVNQIPKAGDYLTAEVGRESIICVRGTDERIRAFYNVCQHRGNRLVSNERGSLGKGQFQCAYHGWRFDNGGTLTWVYCEEDFPQGSPCGNRNLVEIPCDTWAGFVWINMDEGCSSLGEYLDPIAGQLDCYQMEDMKRTHWVTLEGNFNWKCVQDNFNESYHLPFVHPQTLPVMNEHYTGCQFDLYPTGHNRMLMPGAARAPATRATPSARSRRSSRSSPSGSSTPSPTARISAGSGWRCSSASASWAPRRATTSPATRTSSSPTTTTTRSSRTSRSA